MVAAATAGKPAFTKFAIRTFVRKANFDSGISLRFLQNAGVRAASPVPRPGRRSDAARTRAHCPGAAGHVSPPQSKRRNDVWSQNCSCKYQSVPIEYAPEAGPDHRARPSGRRHQPTEGKVWQTIARSYRFRLGIEFLERGGGGTVCGHGVADLPMGELAIPKGTWRRVGHRDLRRATRNKWLECWTFRENLIRSICEQKYVIRIVRSAFTEKIEYAATRARCRDGSVPLREDLDRERFVGGN